MGQKKKNREKSNNYYYYYWNRIGFFIEVLFLINNYEN